MHTSASKSAPRQRAWFVTGCSSGIGKALCRRVLERGERVVATARDPGTLAELVSEFSTTALTLRLDVTDARNVVAAIEEAIAWTGGIDVLVNNAGFGTVGALKETDEDAVTKAFDANVYGPYRTVRAILPHMRERGGGRILNVSSMTGFAGVPGFCFYSATKFALDVRGARAGSGAVRHQGHADRARAVPHRLPRRAFHAFGPGRRSTRRPSGNSARCWPRPTASSRAIRAGPRTP